MSDRVNTIAYRDNLARITRRPGDLVEVLTAFRMRDDGRPGGRFVPDGAEGVYVVLCATSGGCYKLARPPRDSTGQMFLPVDYHETASWDAEIHGARIDRPYHFVAEVGEYVRDLGAGHG